MRQLQLLVLLGSTKDHSSNHKLVKYLEKATKDRPQLTAENPTGYSWNIFPIGALPFFDPDLDKAPEAQKLIDSADSDLNGYASGNKEQLSESLQPISKVPTVVQQLRQKVTDADGVMICTPEYVFSLPGILKNALEWLVATTCLADKPMALITAAASGQKAQESLELITSTLGGKFTPETSIRIPGVAGKFSQEGALIDPGTAASLNQLLDSWLAGIKLKHPGERRSDNAED